MTPTYLLDRKSGILMGVEGDLPLPPEFRNAKIEIIRRFACYRLRKTVEVAELAAQAA